MSSEYIESLEAQLEACDLVLDNKSEVSEATYQKALETREETLANLRKAKQKKSRSR